MATDVQVPTLGESITEGTLAQWLKKPGEAVAADEPIASLETDKVSVEVPSPVAGVLTEQLVEEGANVAVGAVIARIDQGATSAAAAHHFSRRCSKSTQCSFHRGRAGPQRGVYWPLRVGRDLSAQANFCGTSCSRQWSRTHRPYGRDHCSRHGERAFAWHASRHARSEVGSKTCWCPDNIS